MATVALRPSAVGPSQAKLTRGHSCHSCYQRKVKCDGKRPCARCVKSAVECRSERPGKVARAKEYRGAGPSLLDRLRRYEKLLSAHGVPLDDKEVDDKDDVMEDVDVQTGDHEDGPVIVQRGHRRFADNPLWKGLRGELQDADEPPDHSDDDETLLPADDLLSADALVFGPPSFMSLSSFHPTVSQIMMLWQTFLNNFNPLVKLFHAPTVQHLISAASTDLSNIKSSTEALMFSIYLCAVTTMTEQECARLMAESRGALLARFSNATQQALANARFLKTTDLVVLQALALYLLAKSRNLDPQSLWLLTGLADRLGQTMGLHRETGLKDLAPFDAEIRRRLWWQIRILSHRAAKMCGVKNGPPFDGTWDTNRPLNVNDSDLSPLMRELPVEHDGITEMLFCTIRFEIGSCMRRLQGVDGTAKVASGSMNAIIDELERKLEPLLKKCDRSIPLHMLAILMGRSAIAHQRLFCYNPIRIIDRGANVPLEERDAAFELALQILTYDSMAYSNRALQPFLWHVETSFSFEAFILVLTELLRRTKGDDVDRAWVRVNQAYEDHPELVINAKHSPLHAAMGTLALKAWERRMSAVDQQWLDSHPAESHAISRLRKQRSSKSGKAGGFRPEPLSSDMTESDLGDVDASLLGDVDAISWEYWQGLLQDQFQVRQ